MKVKLPEFFAFLTLLGAIGGLWVRVESRLTKLETRLEDHIEAHTTAHKDPARIAQATGSYSPKTPGY